MDIEYCKIIVTILLAVVGWIVGYYVTKRKSVLDKRREIVVEHLIETYRTLSIDIFARPDSQENDLRLEKIVSNIQLFGSPSQIELVHKLVEKIAEGKTVLPNNQITEDHVKSFIPLIDSLRKELRQELKLKPDNSPFTATRSERYCVK